MLCDSRSCNSGSFRFFQLLSTELHGNTCLKSCYQSQKWKREQMAVLQD